MDVEPGLAAIAREVIEANRAAARRIVVAESCTGGLVAAALTAVPGSSDVFDAGFTCYSNEAKISVLGVPEELIDTFGAVSPAVGWAMAQGALDISGADVAVAVTGIAGPDGGTPQKPVGTVVFASSQKGARREDAHSETRFLGDLGRAAIRVQAAGIALKLLLPEGAP